MKVCYRALLEAKVAYEYNVNSIYQCISSYQQMLLIHLIGKGTENWILELLNIKGVHVS